MRERAIALRAKHPELGELLDPISVGNAVEGMESLMPVLVDHLGLLLDELPDGTHVVVCDPERIRTRAVDLVRTSAEFLAASWAAAAGGGQAPVDLGAASLQELADVRDRARDLGLPWWGITPFSVDAELAEAAGGPETVLVSGFEAPPEYQGDADRMVDQVQSWTRDAVAGRRRLRRPGHRSARGGTLRRRRGAGPPGAGPERRRRSPGWSR